VAQAPTPMDIGTLSEPPTPDVGRLLSPTISSKVRALDGPKALSRSWATAQFQVMSEVGAAQPTIQVWGAGMRETHHVRAGPVPAIIHRSLQLNRGGRGARGPLLIHSLHGHHAVLPRRRPPTMLNIALCHPSFTCRRTSSSANRS
jgi:hypothetical protein